MDKKIVHKTNSENVFLCNLRRVLPPSIHRDIFEHDIRERVTDKEFELLCRYYQPDLPSLDMSIKEAESDSYVVTYLPVVRSLSRGVYSTLLAEKKHQWERDLLGTLYTRDTGSFGECFRLTENITEPYDQFLLSSFNAWDSYINTEERTIMSDALEKVPTAPRQNVFFANMHVNTEHPYFFEHSYDHVPSMMLIETVKQFVMASSHKYGKAPLEGSHIIVDSINCKFLNFVNMNFPVLLKSTTLALRVNHKGQWKSQDIRTEVFQGSKCLAVFTFSGSSVSDEVFQMIREDQIGQLKQSRFIPLRHNDYLLELQPEGSSVKVRGSIVNLSVDGISVKLKATDYSPNCDVFGLSLSSAQRDIVHGRYRKIWHAENGDTVALGLQSVKLDKGDLKNLYELICQDCMVLENREVL